MVQRTISKMLGELDSRQVVRWSRKGTGSERKASRGQRQAGRIGDVEGMDEATVNQGGLSRTMVG